MLKILSNCFYEVHGKQWYLLLLLMICSVHVVLPFEYSGNSDSEYFGDRLGSDDENPRFHRDSKQQILVNCSETLDCSKEMENCQKRMDPMCADENGQQKMTCLEKQYKICDNNEQISRDLPGNCFDRKTACTPTEKVCKENVFNLECFGEIENQRVDCIKRGYAKCDVEEFKNNSPNSCKVKKCKNPEKNCQKSIEADCGQGLHNLKTCVEDGFKNVCPDFVKKLPRDCKNPADCNSEEFCQHDAYTTKCKGQSKIVEKLDCLKKENKICKIANNNRETQCINDGYKNCAEKDDWVKRCKNAGNPNCDGKTLADLKCHMEKFKDCKDRDGLLLKCKNSKDIFSSSISCEKQTKPIVECLLKTFVGCEYNNNMVCQKKKDCDTPKETCLNNLCAPNPGYCEHDIDCINPSEQCQLNECKVVRPTTVTTRKMAASTKVTTQKLETKKATPATTPFSQRDLPTRPSSSSTGSSSTPGSSSSSTTPNQDSTTSTPSETSTSSGTSTSSESSTTSDATTKPITTIGSPSSTPSGTTMNTGGVGPQNRSSEASTTPEATTKPVTTLAPATSTSSGGAGPRNPSSKPSTPSGPSSSAPPETTKFSGGPGPQGPTSEPSTPSEPPTTEVPTTEAPETSSSSTSTPEAPTTSSRPTTEATTEEVTTEEATTEPPEPSTEAPIPPPQPTRPPKTVPPPVPAPTSRPVHTQAPQPETTHFQFTSEAPAPSTTTDYGEMLPDRSSEKFTSDFSCKPETEESKKYCGEICGVLLRGRIVEPTDDSTLNLALGILVVILLILNSIPCGYRFVKKMKENQKKLAAEEGSGEPVQKVNKKNAGPVPQVPEKKKKKEEKESEKSEEEPSPPSPTNKNNKMRARLLKTQADLQKLRAHVKKRQAEHKSDTRSDKFQKKGPIFIPMEPDLPPPAVLPDNIVLEKVTYDPSGNEMYDIGSDVDDIEMDSSLVLDPSTMTEDEASKKSKKGSKKSKKGSKKSKKDSKKEKENKPEGAEAPKEENKENKENKDENKSAENQNPKSKE